MGEKGRGASGRSLMLGSVLALGLLFSSVAASAFPPTFVLGLYGSEFLYSSQGSAAEQLPALSAGVLGGWRSAFPAGGSLSLTGDAELIYAPGATPGLYDRESFELQLYVPLGGLRLELEPGLSASGWGTLEGQLPNIKPSWTVSLRWLGDRSSEIRPFADARGYVFVQRGGDEDALYQGGALGVELVPSYRFTWELAVEGGWQRWFEQTLTDPAGQPREDLLGFLRGGCEGLLGYFAAGELSAEVVFRGSNSLEARRWFAQLRGELSWSPRRQLSLGGGAQLQGEWYTRRPLPAPLSDDVAVLSWGVDLGLDWTPDDRWYFVVDTSALQSLSNDPAERGWNLRVQGGVELSF